MRIQVDYSMQVRTSGSGISHETIELEETLTLQQLLEYLLQRHPDWLSRWLTAEAEPRPGLMVFHNDCTPPSRDILLSDHDTVSLLTLVSGG